MHRHAIHTKQLTQLLAVLLSATLLSGCFNLDSQPSEDDVKAMATDRFEQEYKDLFTISNIVKMNGYKKTENQYVAELVITATAQRSLNEYAEFIINDDSISSVDKFTSGMNITMMKLTMPSFKAGDNLEFDRDYLFIKTDNGWRLQKELLSENQLEDI